MPRLSRRFFNTVFVIDFEHSLLARFVLLAFISNEFMFRENALK